MSRLRAVAAVSVALAACEGDAPVDEALRYLRDATFRRAVLERSLTTRENTYARLRLARYPTTWDALPAWNPRAEALPGPLLDAAAPLSPAARSLNITEAASAGEREALRALGEAAFFGYPAQMLPEAAPAVTSVERAASYGFWFDARAGLGGLVRAMTADGTPALAMTCATCHATRRDGALVAGLGNAALDLGALATEGPARAWGPGRVDVSTPDGSAPVRIPDLRPTRYLSHLHYNATVVQGDVFALAVRLETLLITAHHEAVRPPREVSLGLAVYLGSLAPPTPRAPQPGSSQAQGASLFRARCYGCHAPPGFTGPPVPLDVAGVDDAVARSPYRGTGMLRVPSLRGVSARGSLFHDGTVPDLDALLDPARVREGYPRRLHGEGAIVGHPFGLDLTPSERADLVDYLRTL